MPLRNLHVSKCRPGQRAGRAIVDDDGRVVIDQNACLTRDLLVRLIQEGYQHVVVDADDAFQSLLEDFDEAWLKKGLDALAKRGVPPTSRMADLRHRAAADLNVTFRAPSVAALFGDRENVRGLITRTISGEFKPKVLAALIEIKMANPALYVHALMTAVAAAQIARAVGLPDHRTRQLVAGTLLQDIGSIYLPPDLPEKEQLRVHPLLGYRLLRETGYVDALSAQVALEHHECTDGSGEPRGVIGQNTLNVSRSTLPPLPTLVGEIGAVANVYAYKTGKGIGEGLPPDKAVEALRSAAGTKLNRTVVAEFLRATPIYPAGVRVVIRGGDRDGFRGRVSGVNPSSFDRPIVTLERDRRNEEIAPLSFDLTSDRKSRIEVRAW